MDSEEVYACWVNAGNDEVGSEVTLVPEKVLFEKGHAGYNAGFAAGGERVEFEL